MLNLVRIIILIIFLVLPIYMVAKFLAQGLDAGIVKSPVNNQTKKIVTGPIWDVRSVDTVKYSRDVAREKMNKPEYDEVINKQVKNIAELGVTHIAIGTPYDPEFVPFLRRWVQAARRNRIHVYFRGNLAGWEQWFGYKKIDPDAHIKGIREFIVNNPDLFEDGDILSTCTECENGAIGDPRQTRKVDEYRQFLVEENKVSQSAFKEIGKSVKTDYFSMNGDVAKLIMDRETTASLGGVVAIDHYVSSVDKLDHDITELAKQSGGKVILSEWGAPILDINGKMSEDQQASFIADAFAKLADNPNLIGINYWTNQGSSTELWKDDGSAKEAVSIVSLYYKKKIDRVVE